MNDRYSNDCSPFCQVYSHLKILQNGKCLIKGKCQVKNLWPYSINGLPSGYDYILLTILSGIFPEFLDVTATQIIVHHSVNFNAI